MKKELLLFGMSLLLVLTACKDKKNKDDDGNSDPTKIGLAVSPWPCYSQNNQRTNISPNNSLPSANLKWSLDLGVWLRGLVIGPDGTLYVNGQKKVFAVNPDGTLKWSYDAGFFLSPCPVVGTNNRIYVNGYNTVNTFEYTGSVLCLSTDSGTVKWRFNSPDAVNGGFWSSPMIGLDGYLYVAEKMTKTLYALDVNGSVNWSFIAAYDLVGAPAIGSDSTIYLSAYQTSDGKGYLYAIRPGGTEKWKYSANTLTEAVVGPTYLNIGIAGEMVWVTKAGVKKWNKTVPPGSVSSGFAVGKDATVYFELNDGGTTYMRIHQDGLEKWYSDLFGGRYTITNDSKIYISKETSLILFDIATKTKTWEYTYAGFVENVTSPVVGTNGIVYIPAKNGMLYALGQ